jgi:hypothetical protein
MGVPRILIAVTLIALPLTSCVRGTSDVEVHQSAVRLGEVEARPLGQSRWNELRSAMTPSERTRFDQIHDEDARLRFARANGVDVRIELPKRVSFGMNRDEVIQAIDGLADSFTMGDSRANRLHASVFNGEASTQMDFEFDADTGGLASWTSYVANATNRTAAIEAALQGRLDRVLRVGMGQQEITQSYNRARRLASDYDRKAIERRGDTSSYRGFKTASAGDFATEAAWIRANSSAAFYEVLNRAADYTRFEGSNEFWYHTIRIEGLEERVVIEYRFENKRLTSWWVYTSDFLGYGVSR